MTFKKALKFLMTVSSLTVVSVCVSSVSLRAQSNVSAQNAVRLDQLEGQVRVLTGQLEETLFELRQLKDQFKAMQEDTEFRFQDLEGGGVSIAPSVPDGPSSASSPPPPPSPVLPPLPQRRSDSGALPAGASAFRGEAVPPDAANSDFAANGFDGGVDLPPQPSAGAPIDLGAALNQPAGAVADSRDPLLQQGGVASLGELSVADSSPLGLYNAGYGMILDRDYASAQALFLQFLRQYPNDGLAEDATYWLGEAYFEQGQYSLAAQRFSESYRLFPDSEKAPDALLKAGVSLSRLGERDAACATLAQISDRFINVGASVSSASQSEMARLRCG